ncbi:MAG: dimethylargininase [Chloroflexi bacterium]|nr:MAG: dimethylargininase [Chloroflexota bacterium]
MPIALTRAVSASINQCELAHLERQPIDLALARAQHHQYEACLAALGCTLIRLPAEDALPDAVFVEDTAIVLDELAIITRPGAATRWAEAASVAQALACYRTLHPIQPPATLDGGDVLRLGRRLYVGLSGRSNHAAIEQLQRVLRRWDYTVQGVSVNDCLHLKSAVTQVATDTLLLNPAWVDPHHFAGWRIITVDPSEPAAANALLLGETVLYPASYPATRRRLAKQGIEVKTVDVSELIKAEGAVTCCSLIFS